MKIIEFDKNSELWREWRGGRSGGSEFSKLIPAPKITKEIASLKLEQVGIPFNPKSKADEIVSLLTPEMIGEIKADADKKDQFYRLVAQRVARPITPNDYEQELNGQKFSMIARGHILEPQALDAFEAQTDIKVDRKCVVWQREDNENSYVSPDATIKTHTAFVEVKCPDSHVIIRAWHEDKVPEEHIPQLVKHFVVNEKSKYGYLVLYTDVMPSLPILIFRIERKDYERLIQEYKTFEDITLKQVSELAERLSF